MLINRKNFAWAGFVLVVLLAPRPAPAVIEWPMFHGDPRHSGLNSADAPFDSLLAWTFASGDSIFYSSPVLAPDGTIYVGNLGDSLLALSPEGALLWAYEGDGNFRHSTPAVAADGTVFVGDAAGILHAINPDGTRRWTFTAGAPIKTAPNIAADGTVLFGADDGFLYAVNPDSTLRWTFPTEGEIRSSPAIGPDGTVFFGSTDALFYALWPDGSLRWQALTGDEIKYCSPAVTASGIVYFGSYDGFVYALTSDQQFLWAYPTGHVVRSSPAIGPNGEIYIGSDTRLLALNPDGTLAWDVATGGEIYSSPVYFGDDDVVGIGSDDGAFYLVHEDGSLDWRFTVGSPIRTTPCPSSFGNVYVGDFSGKIWAFGHDPAIAVRDVEPIAAAGPRVIAAPNPAADRRVAFRVTGSVRPGAAILVYDHQGRRLARLPLKGVPGRVSWNGRDQHGMPLPAGTYFYRMEGGPATGRVVLVR